jgi:hypothetical protein
MSLASGEETDWTFESVSDGFGYIKYVILDEIIHLHSLAYVVSWWYRNCSYGGYLTAKPEGTLVIETKSSNGKFRVVGPV